MRSVIASILIGAQVLLVLFLLVVAVIPRAVFSEHLRRDYAKNAEYCETDKDAAEHQKTKDCQGLIYKTLDDPVALFTGLLFIATGALFVITIGLFYAALRASKDAERLFRADQRPWIKAVLQPLAGQETFLPDGSLQVKFEISLESLGKTVAEETIIGPLNYSQDLLGEFEKLKTQNTRIAKGLMPFAGSYLFPGDKMIEERMIRISPIEIANTWVTDIKKRVPTLIAVPIVYKSRITSQIHETMLCGSFTFVQDDVGLPSPYPRNQEDIAEMKLKPKFSYFPLESKTT